MRRKRTRLTDWSVPAPADATTQAVALYCRKRQRRLDDGEFFRVALTTLARAVSTSPVEAACTLKSLEARGFLERHTDPEDGEITWRWTAPL